MNAGTDQSERALILAPQGRDGQVAAIILRETGIAGEVCQDLPALVDGIGAGAGLAIIADEALRDADLRPLVVLLKSQPPWSDFPLIVLTRGGGGPERNPAMARVADLLGNVSFIERPFHPATLASVAKTALRGRRRQYEARLRIYELSEAEKRLQTALQGGHLGSWTLDAERRQLESSATHRAHFGRAADAAFTCADMRAAVVGEDRERWDEALHRSLEHGEDYCLEYRVVWPDGSRHWIEARARAVRGDNGAGVQLVGVSLDITARKTSDEEREALVAALAAERSALAELTHTLEQRVQERTAELLQAVAAREKAQEQLLQSQKMETIGQLTGGVAHDFNNLLTAILANLELLSKRVPDDPALHMLIDSALQGAMRGAALTQRMLAFARQQDLKTTAVRLDALLHGMRNLLERSLGPTVALAIDAPPELPAAQVDANQVELAVLNLALNARDAMPDGGEIRIRVGCGSAPKKPNVPAKPGLYIEVADDGQGMDEGTLRRCVEPFFSTKPPGKGTGLGLSMVHGLSVQLGGSLELRSEPGHGTTVTLWLPIADSAPAGSDQLAECARPVRRARVLMIDDDPLIRMSTAALLEDLGHEVVEADSAKQALERLDRGEAFDCVLTDHAMPEMTGLEFIQIARRQYPRLPILLATGYADLAGGLDLRVPRLVKPFRLAQLEAAIARLLDNGDAASRPPGITRAASAT